MADSDDKKEIRVTQFKLVASAMYSNLKIKKKKNVNKINCVNSQHLSEDISASSGHVSVTKSSSQHLCLSLSKSASHNTKMSDQKSKFLQVYSVLKSELLHDPDFDFTDESRQWLDRVN